MYTGKATQFSVLVSYLQSAKGDFLPFLYTVRHNTKVKKLW